MVSKFVSLCISAYLILAANLCFGMQRKDTALSFGNKRFNGTVAKSILVSYKTQCVRECGPDCESVNLGPQRADGQRVCKLLGDEAMNSTQLQHDNGWTYMHIQNDVITTTQQDVTSTYYTTTAANEETAEDGYCDLNRDQQADTNQSGWTVFQRRVDDSVDFYRDWADYESGFGNITGNYWMGLANIHNLTAAGPVQLHVCLETFENESAYALYDQFSISGAEDNYRLSVSGYSGTAGDALSGDYSANNRQFSTWDNDNDWSSYNCAERYHGAWWYNACHYANLNGAYLGGVHTAYGEGIIWQQYKGYEYSLKTTVMKIRPLSMIGFN